MLANKNPYAWQQLIRLLAERIADEVLADGEADEIVDNKFHTEQQATTHARSNLRPIQH